MTIGTTPTDADINITKSTDAVISFTVTDSNGDPFDISIYEFYFVATKKKQIGEKVIEILNADIAQSDSGSGTTDTFTIDLTNSLTDIQQRIYYYEIRSSKVADDRNDVWFNGSLDIQWSNQEAR